MPVLAGKWGRLKNGMRWVWKKLRRQWKLQAISQHNGYMTCLPPAQQASTKLKTANAFIMIFRQKRIR